jgi:hypothetical protein
MSLAYSPRFVRWSLFASVLSLSGSGIVRADPPAAPPPATAPAAAKLRIKNARAITVTLGSRRHEPALAIRPDKGSWSVIFMSELAGASAELKDVTPDAPRTRWVVDVQGDKLPLDAKRFVGSHVYQLDVRKEKRLVGSALVYLYPPPDERTGKVEFTDEDTGKKDDGGTLSSVPKGDL